eukprot:TRINITY_DN16673_c1_g1_i1.p1 TRINITY_DN16673_c1_g1~~TRINITY_DN16673_c1_g1_i1.p1  ORF type:complete len:836 (+),score=357.13 TRINITY_DN16673_c1_g1_i1:116-2509(+)
MSTFNDLDGYKFGDGMSTVTDATDIQQKQDELRHLTDVRIKTLEAQLRQREMEVEHEKNNVKTLTADFEYNLGLIKERDEELEKFEEAMDTMKLAVAERDQEASELRAQLEGVNAKLKTEQRRCVDMETHYQEQLLQYKGEKEALRRKFETELAGKEDEVRRLAQDLVQQRGDMFEEVSGKLQAQMSSSSLEVREREAEWRRREQELQNQLTHKTEQLAAARLDAQKEEQEAANAAAAAARLQDDIARLSKDHELAVQVATTRAEAAEAAAREHEAARSTLDTEVRSTAERLAATAAQLKDCEKQWEAEKRDLTAAAAAHSEAMAASGQREAALGADVAALKEQVDVAKAAEAVLRSQCDASKDALNAERLEAHKARLEAQAFEKEIAASTEDRGRLREEVAKEAAAKGNIEKELSYTRQQLQAEQAKTAKLEAAEADLMKVRAQLRESESLRRKEASQHDTSLKHLNQKLHDATPPHPHPHPHSHHAHHPTPTHQNASLGLGGVPIPGSAGSGFPTVPNMDLSSGSEMYPPVSPVLGFTTLPGGGAGGATPQQAMPHQVVELRSQVHTLQAKNKELSEQNARIRQQVRQFTEEMAAEPIVKRTAELQEEVDGLRKHLNAANREITSLQAELMDKEREGLAAGYGGPAAASSPRAGGGREQQELIVKLTTELLKLKGEADASRKRNEMWEAAPPSPRPGDTGDAARYRRKYEKLKQVNHALSNENADLRARMSQAKEDLKRLISEKESLLEINNMMRSDLHKLAVRDAPSHARESGKGGGYLGRARHAALPSRLHPS